MMDMTAILDAALLDDLWTQLAGFRGFVCFSVCLEQIEKCQVDIVKTPVESGKFPTYLSESNSG